MTFQIALYFFSILLTCGLTGFLAWYAWRQTHVTGARSYAYMVLAESLLALTEVGSMLAGTEEQASFWFSLRVPFTAVIPVFWLFFALDYSGRGDWLSKPMRAALFAIPMITQVVMVTSSLHGLWLVQAVAFEKIGPFWIADTSARIPGIWYLVHTFYSTLLLVAGAGVLVVAASRKPKILLGQGLLVSLGALTALGSALVGVFNLLPDLPFNPFVPGIGFSAVCYALAIFRFQLLKHPPIRELASSISNLEPGEKSSLAVLIFIFILFAALIAAGSYFTYQNYERKFRAQVESQLSAIAALKVDELQDWRSERLADANLFYNNENFSERVRTYLENPQDAEARIKLLTWMEKIKASPEYDRVFLLDARGVEQISIPAAPEAVPAALVGQASASLDADQLIFLDFHRHSDSDAAHLSMVVPVFDAQNHQPLGTLILRINPDVYLYPFIQRWPLSSQSAETLLIRRVGNEILYLNELKFEQNAAMSLRIPLENENVPAVKAVLGQTGIVEGLDYHDVPVVADIRPVPNSPWFLVSKMNTAEVYAPLRERLWQTLLFFGALILITGAGLMLVWRQQRVKYYRGQVNAAEALRLSEEKFRLAFDTSPDSVAITRMSDGMFVSVNKGFEKISGYTREQAIGKTSLEINIWKDPQDRRNVVEGLLATGEVRNYEAPFLALDGEIYGLMSAVIIELNGEPHILNIVRDITERKRAEAILHESETNLSVLIENTDGSIWAVDQQYGLIVGNREFHRNTSAALGRRLEMGESVLLPGFPAEVNAEWQRLYDRALQGERFTLETQTHFLESPHYIEYHFSPICEDGGEIRGVTVYGRDITERKQVEDTLIQVNDRLALAQRLAGAGIWDWELATGKLNWSPEFFHLFGLDPAKAQATFDTWRGALHPDDVQGAEQRIDEAIRDHLPLFNEYRIVTPSGETRWIGAWGDTTYNERGEAQRMTGLCIDITERKQVDTALRESEQRFRDIMENVNLISVILDIHGNIIFANSYFLKLTGWQLEEVLGRNWFELLIPPEAEVRHVLLEGMKDNTVPLYYQNEILTRSGERRLIDWSNTLLRDAQGNSTGIAGIGVDITERKRAEDAMRESEEKFRQAFNTSPIAISIARLKGGGFISVNKNFEQMSGYSESEVIGKTAEELHLWKSPEIHQGLLKELRAKGEVRDYETPILTRNGEIYCLTSASIIEINGEPHILTLAVDITKRKQAEDALLQRENLLNKIFDVLPVGIWLADKNGQLTRSNQRGREIWGAEPLVGQEQYGVFKARRLPSGEELAPEDWALARTIKEGVTVLDEMLEIDSFDGKKKVILNFTAPVFDAAGNVEAAVIINLDITERKQAEEKIKENARLLRIAGEKAKLGGWSVDLRNNLCTWSDQTAAIHERPAGYLPLVEEGISYYAPEWREKLTKVFTECAQNGIFYDEEMEIITANGKRVWVRTIGEPVKDEAGKIIKVQGAFQDITELKRAEQALHESENKYRTLVQNMQVGMVAHRPDTSILLSNAMASQLLGLSPDQMLGKTAIDPAWHFVHEDGTPVPLDEYPVNLALAENQPVRNLVLGIIHPARGFPTWVQCDAYRVQDWEGNLQQVIVTFFDITERRVAEEQLLKTLDELKRSNTELEQFAYVASHDLQEPLRAVAGMVQLLQQRYKGQLDGRADEYIGLAVEGATRMQTLINDLLAYSRVERRGSPIKSTDANAALQSALRNLGAAIFESGAVVTNGSLPTLEADATQLTQLFQNLIGNAIKFRGQDPPNIHVEARDLGNAWQFSVSDNGIGIEPQYYERIFLVFQRLHTRRDYPGTGIGLSICKKIVERHGGRIWIESTPGQGTIFHFTIPHRR